MAASVVTIGGREVQVIGGASQRAAPALLDLSPIDGSEGKHKSGVAMVVVLALLASLLILLSTILVRNRARPA